MKNSITLIIVLSLCLPLLNSCKKGENDPFISLKSRDNKISQKWKLTKSEVIQVSPYSTSSETVTATYDGTTQKIVYTLEPANNKTATGTFEMTLEKNGTLTYNENYALAGSTAIIRSGTSYWNWVNTGKNKSEINIGAGDDLFESGSYVIDRLASKELVLKYDYKITENGFNRSYSCTYTFEKE
ncbi:MAG: hypothetical protein WCK02_00355 [Bacteroidota bacterium]